MTQIEINKACRTIESVEDLKAQREEIIEVINIEEAEVRSTMVMMLYLVENGLNENEDRAELVYEAIDCVADRGLVEAKRNAKIASIEASRERVARQNFNEKRTREQMNVVFN